MSKSPSPIEYLSKAETVSMADDWFEFGNLQHFWMKRRFDVFRRFARFGPQSKWAEVGCGHGVVQCQMEECSDLSVDGMDLNDFALERHIATRGRLLCYNVFDRAEELKEAYDNVILFDVLEHIDDDANFLDAVLHLVKPGGLVFVNVPAFMHMFSLYDETAGHVRRYNIKRMRSLAESQNLSVQDWSYWGFSLVPLLYARKLMFAVHQPSNVIEKGFAVGNKSLNSLLYQWSRLEWIPQHFYGTSLMAVLKKPSASD